MEESIGKVADALRWSSFGLWLWCAGVCWFAFGPGWAFAGFFLPPSGIVAAYWAQWQAIGWFAPVCLWADLWIVVFVWNMNRLRVLGSRTRLLAVKIRSEMGPTFFPDLADEAAWEKAEAQIREGAAVAPKVVVQTPAKFESSAIDNFQMKR